MRAQLQQSGLCTDDAALLPQTLSEIFGLLVTHIEMKKLEAKECIEFLVEWYGDTPIVQEIHQRPTGRPRNQVLHIQAAAQHRRLINQILQEQTGGSLPSSAPTQGQAAWQGRHESQPAWQPWAVPAGSARHAACRVCQGIRGFGLHRQGLCAWLGPATLAVTSPRMLAMQPCTQLAGFHLCCGVSTGCQL